MLHRNETHASTTDPDVLPYRQGPGMEARLGLLDHVLMENRSGLVVAAELPRASGHAERLAALAMVDRLPTRECTRDADRGCDAEKSVAGHREHWITPHVAQNTSGRRSAIDGRTTTRHAGYALGQQARKRIEAAFALGGLLTAAASPSDRAACWRAMDEDHRRPGPAPAASGASAGRSPSPRPPAT